MFLHYFQMYDANTAITKLIVKWTVGAKPATLFGFFVVLAGVDSVLFSVVLFPGELVGSERVVVSVELLVVTISSVATIVL